MIFDELKPGRTVQNNLIRVFKTDVKAKKFYYLVAGIKGRESEGVYVLKNLFKWLRTNHKIKDLPLIVIPILNIDGYEDMAAKNARGVDLFENFPCEENKEQKIEIQSETKFLIKLLKKYPPAGLLHFGSYRPPVINFSERGKRVASFLSKLNFYDLSNIDKKMRNHALSRHLEQVYEAGFIDLKFPRISEELSLNDIWEHNETSLKELIKSELLFKLLNPPKKSFLHRILQR